MTDDEVIMGYKAFEVMPSLFASVTGTAVIEQKHIPPRPPQYDGYVQLFGVEFTARKSGASLRRQHTISSVADGARKLKRLGTSLGTSLGLAPPGSPFHSDDSGMGLAAAHPTSEFEAAASPGAGAAAGVPVRSSRPDEDAHASATMADPDGKTSPTPSASFSARTPPPAGPAPAGPAAQKPAPGGSPPPGEELGWGL